MPQSTIVKLAAVPKKSLFMVLSSPTPSKWPCFGIIFHERGAEIVAYRDKQRTHRKDPCSLPWYQVQLMHWWWVLKADSLWSFQSTDRGQNAFFRPQMGSDDNWALIQWKVPSDRVFLSATVSSTTNYMVKTPSELYFLIVRSFAARNRSFSRHFPINGERKLPRTETDKVLIQMFLLL